jgi:alpha-galactosidase/6-phospho-beta-glucosidase family protein
MSLTQRYFTVGLIRFQLTPFQLDEDSLKEKKKQRLLKAGYEARVRTRREKEREREEKEREIKKEEEERENDFEAWSNRLRAEQEVCLITKLFPLLTMDFYFRHS